MSPSTRDTLVGSSIPLTSSVKVWEMEISDLSVLSRKAAANLTVLLL